MGGRITVASEPGKGSTFVVELQVEALPGEPAEHAHDLKGQDFVVVEGDDINAADLRTYLTSAGARVFMVGNGPEAVEVTRSLQAPVVVEGAIDGVSRDAWPPRTRRLLIARGGRPVARRDGDNVVTIDGNSMRPRSFLHAAAVAAGLASPQRPASTPAPDPDANAPAAGSTSSIQAPSVASARAQGRLILVAEDDSTNQKVIQRQLELLGYAAEVASNGEEAVRLWRSGGYGLVLSDLHMPTMDGYDLMRAIRKEQCDGGRIPILALTANAMSGEAKLAKAEGFDDYLTKPLQLGVLRGVLGNWMRPASDGAAGAMANGDAPPAPSKAVDVRVLEGLVGNAPAAAREILVAFQESARTSAAQIRAATTAHDLPQVGQLAHRLKSSARSVGALVLGDLCAELVRDCRLVDKNSVDAAVFRIEEEVQQVLHEISIWLGSALDQSNRKTQ